MSGSTDTKDESHGINGSLAEMSLKDVDQRIEALHFSACELGGENFKFVLRALARTGYATIGAVRTIEASVEKLVKAIQQTPPAGPPPPAPAAVTWHQEFLMQTVKSGSIPASVALILAFVWMFLKARGIV